MLSVDIVEEKVALLNSRFSPIYDVEIFEFLMRDDLNSLAKLDKQSVYADYMVFVKPTNYDPVTNYFNTSSEEAVIRGVMAINSNRTATTPFI